MPHTEASFSPFRRGLRAILARLDGVFNPYRPELYYMRGPGPKWYARHAAVAAARGITVPPPYRPRRSAAP
jgi:hypothetical protein